MGLATQASRPQRRRNQREVAVGALEPDELSRFEGEGGRAVPEPFAPEPQKTIDGAPSSAANKCETMNERR